MKKYMAIFLIIVLAFMGTSSAITETAPGVQVIGGPSAATEPVSLDDIKLERELTIDGYARITPTSFAFKDKNGYYIQGRDYLSWAEDDYYMSGNEADFAFLRMDIINLNRKEKNFLENCTVKVVYDDVYEYEGWMRQYNYNNTSHNASGFGVDAGKQNTEWTINPDDVFPILPMYEGHYAFICTLPNSVVNAKESLRMVVTLDGNELTYNIRK